MLGFSKKTLEKFSVWDVQFIKLSCFFLGFFVAAFLSKSFLNNYRWLWLGISLIVALKPLYTLLSSKK